MKIEENNSTYSYYYLSRNWILNYILFILPHIKPVILSEVSEKAV